MRSHDNDTPELIVRDLASDDLRQYDDYNDCGYCGLCGEYLDDENGGHHTSCAYLRAETWVAANPLN